MYRVLLFSVVISIPHNLVHCIVSRTKIFKEQWCGYRQKELLGIMFVQWSQSPFHHILDYCNDGVRIYDSQGLSNDIRINWDRCPFCSCKKPQFNHIYKIISKLGRRCNGKSNGNGTTSVSTKAQSNRRLVIEITSVLDGFYIKIECRKFFISNLDMFQTYYDTGVIPDDPKIKVSRELFE